MNIPFYKYQGTGNDFVMIDNRIGIFAHDILIISNMCDRKFGIGADGLILIENHTSLDFEMIYFNADGSKSLCGNGSRCAVKFAQFLGIIEDSTNFLTIEGEYDATIEGEIIHLHMRDQKSPQKSENHYFLNNGSPHHIEFVQNVTNVDVYRRGKEIRNRAEYQPSGTNVNFVEIKNEHKVFVRTYERGVEDETLSCGTGIAASALASFDQGIKSPISIESKGGKLEVCFQKTDDGSFTNIWLIGSAKQVFDGTFEI